MAGTSALTGALDNLRNSNGEIVSEMRLFRDDLLKSVEMQANTVRDSAKANTKGLTKIQSLVARMDSLGFLLEEQIKQTEKTNYRIEKMGEAIVQELRQAPQRLLHDTNLNFFGGLTILWGNGSNKNFWVQSTNPGGETTFGGFADSDSPRAWLVLAKDALLQLYPNHSGDLTDLFTLIEFSGVGYNTLEFKARQEDIKQNMYSLCSLSGDCWIFDPHFIYLSYVDNMPRPPLLTGGESKFDQKEKDDDDYKDEEGQDEEEEGAIGGRLEKLRADQEHFDKDYLSMFRIHPDPLHKLDKRKGMFYIQLGEKPCLLRSIYLRNGNATHYRIECICGQSSREYLDATPTWTPIPTLPQVFYDSHIGYDEYGEPHNEYTAAGSNDVTSQLDQSVWTTTLSEEEMVRKGPVSSLLVSVKRDDAWAAVAGEYEISWETSGPVSFRGINVYGFYC